MAVMAVDGIHVLLQNDILVILKPPFDNGVFNMQFFDYIDPECLVSGGGSWDVRRGYLLSQCHI